MTHKKRGADLLVQSLAAAGVTEIFSLSGNQIMPIYDACLDARIRIVHTRHEAAAVFMAEAYAQLTGNIGVCLVTAAPGAANAVGPLFTARQSESPVLLLTGDSPLALDTRGAFQELDQVPMTSPLTKWSFRATAARGLGEAMASAIQMALSGRPGPVHVALPFDVLEDDAGSIAIPAQQTFARQPSTINQVDTARILQLLAAAETPLVLCGPSMSGTRSGAALPLLADALNAPVVSMESPRGLKDPSLGNFVKAMARADVIVSLGKRIDFTVGYGDASAHTCQWIVVDSDAAERDRAQSNLGERLQFTIDADPRDAALALTAAGGGGELRGSWRAEVSELISERSYSVGEEVPGGKISPAAVCAAVQRQVAKVTESLIICDGGEFGQWSQAGTHSRYRVINGPAGAIGGALCYGIAAKVAKADATVFALMGDGTVGFHFAEFETAVREQTPFVVIVGNDRCWNAEHQIQLREYGPDRLIGCQLSGARYDKAVEALGGHGEHVTQLEELDAALERAISSGKVACVNVDIVGLPAPAGASH